MKERKRGKGAIDAQPDQGAPLEGALARRERLANAYGVDFGRNRIFPELVEAMLMEVPYGSSVLEVGAATGLLTRPLIAWAGYVTALEPSSGMLQRLLETDVADSPYLTIVQGMVEDLLHDQSWDVAVVTFTPRRGLGLSRLLVELAMRVRSKVILLLDEDGSMDWAYLARAAAVQGFDVRLSIITGKGDIPEERQRAVLLVAEMGRWIPAITPVETWAVDAREIEVPYPPPRGTATRLVRFLLTGGDRAIRIVTDRRGVDRLYGNLRTAVHRLGRDEVTVRRQGDEIQLVRLPKGGEDEDS